MSKDTGGPAFPQRSYGPGDGMTLRDYFAAAALSNGRLTMYPQDAETVAPLVARWAYVLADAMLAERAKP